MVGVKIVITELGVICGYLFGAWDGLFNALIALMIIDYITGVIKAIINKKLSSEVGYKGILKKISLFIVVAVANIVDMIVFSNSMFLRQGILLLFISNEGISIIENLALIGVPIPKSIISVLSQVRKASKTENLNKEKVEEIEKDEHLHD